MLVLRLLLLTSSIASIQCFKSLQHSAIRPDKKNVAGTNLHASVNTAAFDLVVWDCDGVLVDSEALLKQGEVEALSKAAFTVTVDDCVRLFSGFSPDAATANFLKEMGRPLPVDFFKEQVEGSLQLFRDRLVPLMKDTVIQLHEVDKVRMCVASGSPRNRVDISLVKGGIGHCFAPNTCLQERK